MADYLTGRKIFLFVILIYFVFSVPFNSAFASETNGTIDPTYKYAWGENIGWLNFGCDKCNVHITDSGLTGYAWDRQYGWINLSPANNISGVKNTSMGVLSGDAWGSNIGWVDFSGVTISSSGEFSGYATVKSDGSKINFNCATGDSCATADFKVKTDWRPANARTSHSSGGYQPPSFLPPIIANPIASVVDNVGAGINSISNSILNFFKPKIPADILVIVPKVAPFSLNGRWDLLPTQALDSFAFAPLPNEVRILASKFPELDKTFNSLGIERLSDLIKLNGIALNIPGLSTIGQGINNVNLGKTALVKGLPISQFSLSAKNNLPAEFVFARTNGEKVDLNVTISVDDKGKVTQQISSLPGKTMKLVVKPISSADSVTGYFVFKSATPKISEVEVPRSSLTASALSAVSDLVENVPQPVPIENKLVLSSFAYTDPDHDGIYTADVASPAVPGEYEVITVIDYKDPVLGTREIRMTDVVDPEGYVFEKNNGKETRIPSATVSLYALNSATQKYELWPARDYSQENPQVTDVRGTYSFLVPGGLYYFRVEASDYEPYQGEMFSVAEGSSIHQNIELKPTYKFFSGFDWETALLVIVFLLLVYNLLKDKLSKFFKR